MVPLSRFNDIIYKRPRLYRFEKPLEKIIGFDSEAYRTGKSFMYCTSLGDVITPDVLLDTLFSDKYAGSNFVTWNLKYESGAILQTFPRHTIKRLQEQHKAVYIYKKVKYEITYIPHKRLKIKQLRYRGKAVRFWDMSPFYGRIKLATASKEYLKETKFDMDPNLFTEEYVSQHYEEIAKYCIQDSALTQKLSILWIDKFQETGISVCSLYSEASISFAYISHKTEIVTPYEFWDYNKKLVRYAFESYEGGKFEITSRGKFTGYEFDISSAYPTEISQLVDIRNARVEYSKKYNHEAVYGFLRVKIQVHDPLIHLPCGVFRKLRLYPMGTYFLTITKQEYDYIKNELPYGSVSIEIVDAAWLIKYRRTYPYKEVMLELYDLKTKWKKIDRFRSNNYKIIMNGFYGKMAQCIPSLEGDYQAGIGWNPIYASVITANTRISVTRLQNLLKDSCLAVHTDSVITTTPIPKKFMGTGLGEYELVEQGEGVLVACGIYDINGVCALKGFKKNSLREILTNNPDKKVIRLVIKNHVESWLQAMSQNHSVDNINVFSDMPKDFTLNCDTKRLWPNDMTSTEFLTTFQKSHPLQEEQHEPPSFWSK